MSYVEGESSIIGVNEIMKKQKIYEPEQYR